MIILRRFLHISFVIGTIILFCIIVKCKDDKNDEQEKIIKNLVGMEMELPDSLVSLENHELDTININHFDSDIQMLSFIDGRCGVCVKKLSALITLKTKLNKSLLKSPDYLFFVYTEDYSHFKEKYYPLLDNSQPIIIQSDLSFLDENPLPGLGIYRTVLTINDTIRVVGNPSGNKELTNLYKKVINKH